jgi:hypothetical protein
MNERIDTAQRVIDPCNYSDWLRQQTFERQKSSFELLRNCQRLGVLEKTEPFSEEAIALRDVIAAHYRKFPDKNAAPPGDRS